MVNSWCHKFKWDLADSPTTFHRTKYSNCPTEFSSNLLIRTSYIQFYSLAVHLCCCFIAHLFSLLFLIYIWNTARAIQYKIENEEHWTGVFPTVGTILLSTSLIQKKILSSEILKTFWIFSPKVSTRGKPISILKLNFANFFYKNHKFAK